MGIFWKKPLWQPIHKKAMLVYFRIAGFEQGRAQLENREFDHTAACRELALQMCGRDKFANVEALIFKLQAERGGYIAELLREFGLQLLDGASPEEIEKLAEHVSRKGRKELLPQLVICNVIENTYGRLEAARYAVALVQGKAR
jgi:hypothetical protein